MADDNQPVPPTQAPQPNTPASSAGRPTPPMPTGRQAVDRPDPPPEPAGGPTPIAGEPAPPKGGGSKTLIILIVVALVLAGATAGYYWWQSTQTGEESESTVSTPSVTTSPKRTAATSPTASTVSTATEDQPIVVTKPVANQLVTSPVQITGTAIAFENTIAARIKDSNGQVLGTVTITTNAPDVGQPGNYSASLTFSAPTTDTGSIEVYESDAATGADKNTVTIQVRFK